MSNIKNNTPRAPMWPWGGQGAVRERLVRPSQVNNKKTGKTGNPKNPAIPSSALLASIAPPHSAEELRLAQPALPKGHDADLAGFSDQPNLHAAAGRLGDDAQQAIERGLEQLNVPPDRLDRLKALLGRESQMLALVGEVRDQMVEIQQRIREEQKEMGY